MVVADHLTCYPQLEFNSSVSSVGVIVWSDMLSWMELPNLPVTVTADYPAAPPSGSRPDNVELRDCERFFTISGCCLLKRYSCQDSRPPALPASNSEIESHQSCDNKFLAVPANRDAWQRQSR